MWGEPKEGRRRKIGELWRDSEGYVFAYVPEVRLAQAEGFRLLPEFSETRGLDTLTEHVIFSAGTRYYPAADQVRAGTALELRREPQNAQDKFATMVLAPDGQHIG